MKVVMKKQTRRGLGAFAKSRRVFMAGAGVVAAAGKQYYGVAMALSG